MHKREGFTLIELLVVIAIIALLISILMPALSQVRKQAKDIACRSNLRQWGLCLTMYANDNDGRLPSNFEYLLYPYYKNVELLLCPSATKKGTIPGNPGPGTGDTFRGGKFEAGFDPVDPSLDGDNLFPDGIQRDILGSYGLNNHVGGTGDENTTKKTDWLRIDAKGASRGPFLLDGAGGGVALHYDEPPEWDGQIYYGYTSHTEAGTPNDNESRNFCINRHHEAINVVFLDSHARKVGLKELWELSFMRTKWFTNPKGFPDPYPPWRFRGDPTHWMYSFRNYK